MTIRIHEKLKFYLFGILRPYFYLLGLHVTYLSILADFQNKLKIDSKILLRISRGENMVYVHWHRNPESLREC